MSVLTKYKLTSNSFIHAPGIFEHARRMYDYPTDDNSKTEAVVLLETAFNIVFTIAEKLLNGEIDYTINRHQVEFYSNEDVVKPTFEVR